ADHALRAGHQTVVTSTVSCITRAHVGPLNLSTHRDSRNATRLPAAPGCSSGLPRPFGRAEGGVSGLGAGVGSRISARAGQASSFHPACRFGAFLSIMGPW